MKKKYIVLSLILFIIAVFVYFGLNYGKKYVIEKSIEKIAESDNAAKEQFSALEERIGKELNKEASNQNTSSPSPRSDSGKNSEPASNPDFIGPIQQKEKNDSGQADKTQSAAANNSSGNAKSFWEEPLVKSVAARFTQAEIAELSKMAAGGFTAEEKARVKSIVYAKVSSSEINELKRLYYIHSGK